MFLCASFSHQFCPSDIEFFVLAFRLSLCFVNLTSFLLIILKQIVLEADGYQPYLISPEKGLRSLIKGVLELAKEPSRLCVDEVNLAGFCFFIWSVFFPHHAKFHSHV